MYVSTARTLVSAASRRTFTTTTAVSANYDVSAYSKDKVKEKMSSGEDGNPKPATTFDASGKIGSQFTEDGLVGGTADAVGGPLSKDGSVGKQFTQGGSIGGKAQEMATDGKPGVFDKDGAVGKHFTAGGAVGGTAQKVGGPFDKEGAIGKHFNEDGTIGGTVQDKLGGK